VVVSGRSPSVPSGGCGVRGAPGRSSPPPGLPSQGYPTSRSAPPDVAATLVRRSLLAVWFGHEVFHRPVCPGPTPETAPAGLGPSQGFVPRFRVPASRPRPSPPGISRPFDDMGQRVRCSRGMPPPARSVLEVSHLRDGFLPARFAASGAAAVHGVLAPIRDRLRSPSRSVSPRRFAVSCRRVSAPPALRTRRRETPRRPTARSPCALARSSADVRTGIPGRSPPEHTIPFRRGDRRRHDPLARFSPRPSGEGGPRVGAPGSFGPGPADLVETRSSHGVSLHRRDALWRLPVRSSVRRRRAVRSRKPGGP